MVTALLCWVSVGSANAEYQLEQILDFPYPTELVAAARAERIAWVMQHRGVRNVWTAAAPDFEPRCLTSYDRDDGQPLSSLQLTADGALLVFVRGGDANVAGEIPNPDHDPAGAKQEIWAVPTGTGEPWLVAAGAGPVITPEANRLVFAKGGQLFRASLGKPSAGGQSEGEQPSKVEPELLLTVRGTLRGVTFSADGGRLAFVSTRGDHAFVGFFDLTSRRIAWLASSVDRDRDPVWSPDGQRLAWIRQPGLLMGELPDLGAGVPFSLWVAEIASGESRQVWASPADDGGFAQWYPERPLAWLGNERLVFTSEHEGWLHAYTISTSQGAVLDLSPGEAEIESFVVAPDEPWVYFWGNHLDRDRRHLWRADASGRREQLTRGEGIESHPVPLAGGRFVAFRGADARRPQAIEVLSIPQGRRQRVAPADLPPGFPTDELITPRPVSFTASDGLAIHGQIFLPPGARAGDRRPGVLFLHGGPIRQMLLGWHYRGYYANCYAFNQYLASRGMVVVAVNYRTGIGHGRAFRRAENQGPRGAAEYRDILAAGRYLARRPEIDPAKIGLWGGSYGGYLTAMGLARDSALFAAGVDLHGVHDWSYRGENFPVEGGGWGLQGDELLELARRSSPVADLSFWSSPVLLVHGDDDRNVMFIQTTDLVQRLRRHGVHVETLVFPDEVHGFLKHRSWLDTFVAAADFFARFLGSGD